MFSGTKKAPSVNKVKRKGGQNVTIGGKVVGKTTKGINSFVNCNEYKIT